MLSSKPKRMLLFFFFQAEDGIRDVAVTGVQTCALPISSSTRQKTGTLPVRRRAAKLGGSATSRKRSEERRVGKECRSRWSPPHYNKKENIPDLVRYFLQKHGAEMCTAKHSIHP